MKRLHIAVGVVSDADGRILISERKRDCAYAGQWEFPGGKCEPAECVESALARELQEELGIQVQAARPLIRLDYRYPDRHVLLDTWRVTVWQGHAEAREGQRFEWVLPQDLGNYPMLAANRPILRAVQLPDHYLVTPEPGPDLAAFLSTLVKSLAAGVQMLRLRAPRMGNEAYEKLARECLRRCRLQGARLLLDRGPAMCERVGADGLHLSAAALRQLGPGPSRPVPVDCWLGVSCHDRIQLERAVAAGADFCVLGPVKPTPTHPESTGMGWPGFQSLVGELGVPVYGIGGLGRDDLSEAWRHRAQGVAAIRALWQGHAAANPR